ncbi:glycoside hydrolase family 31 protein [Aquimarina rhabdastrellae]
MIKINLLKTVSLIAITTTIFSCKQQPEGPFQGIADKQTHLEVYKDDGMYIIKPYSDKIIETSFVPKGEEFSSESHAVVLKPTQQEVSLQENDSVIVYGTTGISVQIKKSPFNIKYFYKGKELISEKEGYIKTDSTEVLNFNLDGTEKIYGAGARVVGMNRRGYRLQLYNRAHYGYGSHSELLNYTMPLIYSSKKYAVHFDNAPIGFLDIDSKKDNTLSYETISGRKTYQVIAGEDWEDLVGQYTTLTGKQPLPPRWALGNFASRFGYHSEKETRDVVARFKKDEIPLDAVILDIYWFGKDIKGTMGNLEFLKDSFPTPKKMINDFKTEGVKTVLITEPFVLTTSKKWKEAAAKQILGKDSVGNPYTYDFYFGNTGIIDIYNPEGKEWFWNVYKKYADMGVSGWWGDLGEPEVHPSKLQHAKGSADEVHNIYGHDWARLLHEGYQKEYPTQRPFILMRAGYSGSQRFGMIPWSGDVSRSWEGLQAQTEIALQMGMQGLGYMHSDLGGFAGGEKFDPELYTRWLQYGVFQPIFRPHAQEEIAPEPVFHDDKTKALAKKAIELRYSLLPYNYTLAFDNNQTGLPLMRPVFFEEEDNASINEVKKTYLWGEDLLVSPVVAPGVKTQEVYFPTGHNWFDFFTGKLYSGGKKATVAVVEDHIPVFVKGGAFIPTIKPIQTTAVYQTQEMNVDYYYDNTVAISEGEVYDDNGTTPQAFEKRAYELLKFKAKAKTNALEFTFNTTVGKTYTTKDRTIAFTVHNITTAPKTITVDGTEAKFTYNETLQTVIISLNWKANTSLNVNITL